MHSGHVDGSSWFDVRQTCSDGTAVQLHPQCDVVVPQDDGELKVARDQTRRQFVLHYSVRVAIKHTSAHGISCTVS